MILSLPGNTKPKPVVGLLALGLVLGWAAFTLAGPRSTKLAADPRNNQYANTEKDMRLHANAVYAQVGEFEAGDVNGDGEVTKEECWAFLAAAVMLEPDAMLAEYPKADHNGDGVLELVEAYQFVRGDYDLEATYKRMGEPMESAKKSGDEEQMAQVKAEWVANEMATYHVILDRRTELLETMAKAPDLATVQAVMDKMAQYDSQMTAKDLFKKSQEVAKQIQELRIKAQELRTAAASYTGQEADFRIQKAEMLELKASDLQAKITQVLSEQIAQLEQAGDLKAAQALQGQLTKINEL